MKINMRFFVTLIILFGFVRVSVSALSVAAVLGQRVELQFPCLQDKNFDAVMISRPGVPGYVLFIRDGRPDNAEQNPGYSGRVDLTSNLTLQIRDVTHEDKGEFMCSVSYDASESKEANDVTCSVNLTLTDENITRSPKLKPPPAEEDEDVRWKKTLKSYKIPLILIVLLPIFGVLFFGLTCR